jgi:hypothetical protein
LVAREKTVLAEYTASSGNFPTVTIVLLGKIPPSDGRMSYVYDKLLIITLFHLKGIGLMMCMLVQAYLSLHRRRSNYISMYGR